MKMKLADIVRALHDALSHVGADLGEEIDVEMNHYWIVLPGDWTDIENTPEPAVGSLEADWEDLQPLLRGDRPAFVGDLDRLAAILRAISETAVPTTGGG